LLSTLPAQAAWWAFCDRCESDAEFARFAIRTGDQTPVVYVSNRISGTTRKFRRSVDTDTSTTGANLSIETRMLTMTTVERATFERVLTAGSTFVVTVDRSELDSLSPIGKAASILQDLRSGFLTQGMNSALQLCLQQAGHLPDRHSVNDILDRTADDPDFLLGQSSPVRSRPLSLRILYPDGSSLGLTRQPNGGFDRWSGRDADGAEIVFDGRSVHAESFAQRSPYRFGPGDPSLARAAEGLISALDRPECQIKPSELGALHLHCDVDWAPVSDARVRPGFAPVNQNP